MYAHLRYNVYTYMNSTTQSRIEIINRLLHFEAERYKTTIQEGNFADAKAIKNLIHELEGEMEALMPIGYTSKS